MTSLSKYNNIYFIGIGGIGMSALAQLFKHQGKNVSGSDREESPVTQLLAHKDIAIHIGQEKNNIPANCDLVVYSDAVPEENPERQAARAQNIPELSYFEALGEISKKVRTIAVAGTHGKTTTTGMLAKILQFAGKKPTAIIGSIVQDFGSNFLAGTNDLFVVEACEYKDHLLKLAPEILVITNIELDHTDYFPSIESLQETFRKAIAKVPQEGCVVANPYDPVVAAVLTEAKAPIIDYTTQTVPALKQIGEFNRENARAAKAAARAAFPHLSEEYTDKALIDFKGSWRRFEYKGETARGALVYDDYAHHPTAIRKTLEAARQEFPDKNITVVFHPHLFSRTRDLMDDFARALALADEIVLAPIYAAREEPIDGVTSKVLAEKIQVQGKRARAYASLSEIRDVLLDRSSEHEARSLILTMGAGDIYKVAEQITD